MRYIIFAIIAFLFSCTTKKYTTFPIEEILGNCSNQIDTIEIKKIKNENFRQIDSSFFMKYFSMIKTKDINSSKADKTPEEAGLKLIKKPDHPKVLPTTCYIKNKFKIKEWDMFLNF